MWNTHLPVERGQHAGACKARDERLQEAGQIFESLCTHRSKAVIALPVAVHLHT